MRDALARIDIYGPPQTGLHYLRARPDPHGGASAAPVTLRLP
jgi:hypothetical protein